MSIETVSTILTRAETAVEELIAAEAFARAQDAHLHVLTMGIGVDQPAMVQTALDAAPVPTGMAERVEEARAIATIAEEHLSQQDLRWDVDPVVTMVSHAGVEIARHTRFSDLVVLHRPDQMPRDQVTAHLAEVILFDAHAPLLILPAGSKLVAPPRQIMVAWDDSGTALRAARLAMPLLRAADRVQVALVDPSSEAADRSDPGGAFAQYLARQGVKAEVTVLSRSGASIAETLERRAREVGCELIVMGAYGHSRLREAIFGGTTRYVLEQGKMPVFLAH